MNPSPYNSNLEHLQDELARLNDQIAILVAHHRAQPNIQPVKRIAGLTVSDAEVDALLPQMPADPEKCLAMIQEKVSAISQRLEAGLVENKAPFLYTLAVTFNLSAFDVAALVLAAAVDVDTNYRKLFGYLHDDKTAVRPRVDLCLELLSSDLAERAKLRARFEDEAPLFKYRLIHLQPPANDTKDGLLAHSLHLDAFVLNHLLDLNGPDPDLKAFVSVQQAEVQLEDFLGPQEITDVFAPHFLGEVGRDEEGRLFHPWGPAGAGKRFLAEALCQKAGLRLMIVDCFRLVDLMQDERLTLARILRQARLNGACLYFDSADHLVEENGRARRFAWLLGAALAQETFITWLASERRLDLDVLRAPLTIVPLKLSQPDYGVRHKFWTRKLGDLQPPPAETVSAARLADRFRLTLGRIDEAVTEAVRQAELQGREQITETDLCMTCRQLSGSRMGAMAVQMKPLYTWDDIVLPDPQMNMLREICKHVSHRHRVYEEWGFRARISTGKGLSILFAGPSGTGKTMAAEVIANQLALDMYKIDLSAIISKYIGETEKNLEAIFAEAENSNAILFFDEADAVFGKRTDLKDAHDRHANTEVNYLLQRMDVYEGICILATNFRNNMDEAFMRRLRYAVSFPFPDETQRLAIWQKVFPPGLPLAKDVALDFLAKQFRLTGGNIRNVAVNASFMAADQGELNMQSLILAVRRELEKLGRLVVPTDFGAYHHMLEEP